MEDQTKLKAILPQDIETTVRQYVFRLRVKFLVPSILMLIFAVTLLIFISYLHESSDIDRELIQLQLSASKLYKNSIKQNAKTLQVIMDSLNTNHELASALSKQDHSHLLKHSASIYENFNRHYGITHFYFSNPERVNILRVHKPEKYGDIINRHTTMLAQQDGAEHYGVELGAMGTITLRYVKPWYGKQTHTLLGFVELGMEVDVTIDVIRSLLGLDAFVLVNKRHLEKNNWEEGSKTFGYETDWERFPQVVLNMNIRQSLPEALSILIQKTDFNNPEPLIVSQIVNNQYAIFVPLNDALGHRVGNLVMIKDVSSSFNIARETVLIGTLILLSGSIIVIVFFYWFVGRMAGRMARNEITLQQLATHDCLTGLLNRRQFDLTLENALTQFSRYGRSVSLLMIDVDYFKQVNDKYGHIAGDAALVEIGKRLAQQARIIDSVFRYGGEEFSIILPETDSESATFFAQRLCEAISKEQYSLDKKTKITITISIGIASCPVHADTERTLVHAADSALYEAKQAGRNRVCNYSDIAEN